MYIEFDKSYFQLYNEFYSFTRNAIDYLKDKINTIYDLKFNIINYDIHVRTYGARNLDNIKIYLFNIVNNNIAIYYNRGNIEVYNRIKFQIVATIVHEIFHTIQDYNVIPYGRDIEYKEIVEGSVEYQTAKWILDHEEELKQNLQLEDIFRFEGEALIYLTHSKYQNDFTQTSIVDYYINNLTQVLNKHYDICNIVRNILMYNKFSISFNNGPLFTIKDGQHINQDINSFNQLVYWYFNFDISSNRLDLEFDASSNHVIIKMYAKDLGVEVVTFLDNSEE